MTEQPAQSTSTVSSTAATAARLPAPTAQSDADVVIFDGNCRFCIGQVWRLHRLDWFGRLTFLSLHSPLVQQWWPELDFDALMKEMYVLDTRGEWHRGAGALRYLSRRLVTLWPVCPWLHIPGSLPFWSWCYRHVANRRYRLAGRAECDSGACAIHFPDAKQQHDSSGH